MPLAVLHISLDPSSHQYSISLDDEVTQLLLTRIPLPLLHSRLHNLSGIVTSFTPSPLFNILPVFSPWFMFMPLIAVTQDKRPDADWTWLILVSALAFILSTSIGLIYVNKRIFKRHIAIKNLLDTYTMADAFQSDRHVVWRIRRPESEVVVHSSLDRSRSYICDWYSNSHETTIEIVILGPIDCVDEQGNIISLSALYGNGVINDPEILIDPPPAYSTSSTSASIRDHNNNNNDDNSNTNISNVNNILSPPEYSVIPLTLYDAEFELHHSDLRILNDNDNNATSSSVTTTTTTNTFMTVMSPHSATILLPSSSCNSSVSFDLPLGTEPGPMVHVVPIPDAPPRTASRLTSFSSSRNSTILHPTTNETISSYSAHVIPNHIIYNQSLNISNSDFSEMDVTTIMRPPPSATLRSSSLFRSTTISPSYPLLTSLISTTKTLPEKDGSKLTTESVATAVSAAPTNISSSKLPKVSISSSTSFTMPYTQASSLDDTCAVITVIEELDCHHRFDETADWSRCHKRTCTGNID